MILSGQKRVQKRTDILNELREISPILANIPYRDVYQAPIGYFDTLGELVMGRIQKEQIYDAGEQGILSPVINDLTKTSSPFIVPTGYFEGFAEKMMGRIRAQEINSVSEEMELISPLLSRIDKKMPYSVPAGYFNELAGNLAVGLKPAELVSEDQDNLPALLNGLKNIRAYEAPVEYFDGFSASVLAHIKQSQQGKVIPFAKKTNWLKYAAAAVVIGIIATGGLLFFNRHSSTVNGVVPSLAMISDQEMINYLDDQSTPAVSADSSVGIASADVADITESDASDLLGDVPDEELQQYVDEHISSKNLITN
jgi:hypothetical protein